MSNFARKIHVGKYIILLLLIASQSVASPVVQKIRSYTAPDHTRVVLDISSDSKYKVTRYSNPERIAIDIIQGSFVDSGTKIVGDSLIKRIRCNSLNTKAQVVLDLKGKFGFEHFALKADNGRPDRIVVDVLNPQEKVTVKKAESPDVITVVIDAGHGGMDPGAIKNGVREKDVVLKIAKELEKLINNQKGMKAVLTRKGDYFVKLKDRVKIAEKAGGDLLISIHANSHKQKSLKGAEVFFLSLEGATDEESRRVANLENAADCVGLPPESDHDDSVVTILMDLKKTQTLNNSKRLADEVIGAIRRSGIVKIRKVKQAGFLVLHTIEMPSVLVETGFLTNTTDRKLLSSTAGQKQMAFALNNGIRKYFNLPEIKPAQRLWTYSYKIKAGDNLTRLARKYGTTVREIKKRNKLKSDKIMVGQTIKLPVGSGK